MDFLLRRHVVSIKFSHILIVNPFVANEAEGVWSFPVRASAVSKLYVMFTKTQDRRHTLGMTLLPFLSEPLPWHFSRAANGAADTVGHRTEIQMTSPCRQQILNTF